MSFIVPTKHLKGQSTLLEQEGKKLYRFFKGGDDTLPNMKVENMFIQMLEGLHQPEAEALIKAGINHCIKNIRSLVLVWRKHFRPLSGAIAVEDQNFTSKLDPTMAQDKTLPYTAYLVEYHDGDKVCYDIASAPKTVDLFDYYWDNYKPDSKNGHRQSVGESKDVNTAPKRKRKIMKQEIYTKVDPRTVGETLMPDDEMTEEEMERQKNIELGAKVSAALGNLFISPLCLCLFGMHSFLHCLHSLP